MLSQKLIDTIKQQRGANIEKLFEFLRFASIANITGPDGACRPCAEWLCEHLQSIGLDAKLFETDSMPVVFAQNSPMREDRPTVLFYGHYDVQPADPPEAWRSEPFESEIRDDAIYARGATDDKGPVFTHLAAIQAYLSTEQLPVNIKVVIEGEEEVGSPNFEAFIDDHADELTADAAVISDTEFFAPDLPALTYSLRGLLSMELSVSGPKEDLHSGLHGGTVSNPMNVLAKLIGGMHDKKGRITLDGFYDDVVELTEEERNAWRNLPFDENAYAESLGVKKLRGGERDKPLLERRWARPTLDCHGIVGGYTDPGMKNIIPAKAVAKLPCRLVANQDPMKIFRSVERYVKKHAPADTNCTLHLQAAAGPVLSEKDSPAIRAAAAAVENAFGAKPAMIRCGASIPVVDCFQHKLGLNTVLMGLSLPDDHFHAPNEKFELGQFDKGTLAAAEFYARFAAIVDNQTQ